MSAKPASEPAWYCLKTQTKREAIAAAHLRELEGVEVFCPLLRYRKATRRGKVWWVEALFPGYLLARFHLESNERAVMYSQGVRGLVRFGDKVPEVPDDFVEALREEVAKQGEKEILTVGPKIAEPSTFPASRLSGMKTQHSSPRRAACAETLLARFPVDAHARTSIPSSTARVAATDTTRSLYDSVGWLTESSLI